MKYLTNFTIIFIAEWEKKRASEYIWEMANSSYFLLENLSLGYSLLILKIRHVRKSQIITKMLDSDNIYGYIRKINNCKKK